MNESKVFIKNLFRKAYYSPVQDVRLNIFKKTWYWYCTKRKKWSEIPNEISHSEWCFAKTELKMYLRYSMYITSTIAVIKFALYERKRKYKRIEYLEHKKYGELDSEKRYSSN